MDWEITIAAICTCLSFCFSASETALTSLGRLEVQGILAKGGRPAHLVTLWIKDERRWLTAVLVGNNVANIAASSVMTLWATEHYPQRLSSVIGGLTLFIIVFSEILPKLWANEWSTKLAPYSMMFLRVVDAMLRPLVIVLQKLTSTLVVSNGMPGRELYQGVSEEELEQTIEMAKKGGGIDRETGEALSNVIDFPELLARDVMIPRTRIQSIPVTWNFEETLRFTASDGHSRYPVTQGSLDRVMGILLIKDLLAHMQRSSPGSWTKIVRKPYFVPELMPIAAVMRDMKRYGAHLALVRNETGVVTGLLTLEDILEEIVGEIRDETDDPSEAGFEGALGGPRLVSGEIPIVDFNDLYRGTLPMDGSFSTLNGYLLSRTGGQIPPVGTLVFGDDKTFKIHSVSDKGIATVEIIDHATGGEG